MGTENYMAPEIFKKNYFGVESDLFAAGVTLFNMFVGVNPFQKADQKNDYLYKLFSN